MKNIIKTEKGLFAVVERYGKDFKIEMFDPYVNNPNILYVQYSSDFFRLKDKEEIKILFKELEPQIIKIMKFYVNENIEFYKHFDFDYTLISGYAGLTPTEIHNNDFFHISCEWFLNFELKTDSLQYLMGLSEEQKRNSYNVLV